MKLNCATEKPQELLSGTKSVLFIGGKGGGKVKKLTENAGKVACKPVSCGQEELSRIMLVSANGYYKIY